MLPRLQDYALRRLLGDPAGLPVEAWPEGGQAHLSGEAALFAVCVTEGLFGLQATGLPIRPQLVNGLRLRGLCIAGTRYDIHVERHETELSVTVTVSRNTRRIAPGKGARNRTAPQGTC